MSERITVGLLPKVSAELATTRAMTGMSKTDIVNRAITLYALVDHQLRMGRKLAFYDEASDAMTVVHVL